jgi:hypothetical protein
MAEFSIDEIKNTKKINKKNNFKTTCDLCNCFYLNNNYKIHCVSNKHVLNQECYNEATLYINNNNIIDVDEQLKVFNDVKAKKMYYKLLENNKQFKKHQLGMFTSNLIK